MTIEIKTLGTRELAETLNRANPYEVYKDVAQRMKDAGFTEKPTMSRVLETLSPTDSADKSGLDAFERLLKEAYRATPTTKTLRTAYQHIWGYFKKRATSPEKDRYKELDESLETKSADMNQFLKELTQKYQPAYLIQSRIMQLDASDLK